MTAHQWLHGDEGGGREWMAKGHEECVGIKMFCILIMAWCFHRYIELTKLTALYTLKKMHLNEFKSYLSKINFFLKKNMLHWEGLNSRSFTLLPNSKMLLFYRSDPLCRASSGHKRNLYKNLLYQYGSNHEIKTMQEVKEEKFNVIKC